MSISVDLPELIRMRGVARRLAKAVPGAAGGLFSQAYRSLFRGRGLDFDSVRAYQPGDDFRNLDWRVAARTGRLHTKLFREEREHSMFLALDVSSVMRFGTRNEFKLVTAARAAAVLAWLAVDNGDRVGLVIFGGNRALAERAPEGGESGVIPCLRLMADATRSVPSGEEGASSLGEAMKRLRRHARPGSLVCALADAGAFDDEARRQLARFSREGDALLLAVSDPLERELPSSGTYLFSQSGREVTVDCSFPAARAEFTAVFAAREAELGDWARANRIRHARLGTELDIFENLRDKLFRQVEAAHA